MKKYLLVGLLAVGTMLPTNNAMSSMVAQARIINMYVEGDVFSANSDPASGPLLQIQIFNVMNAELVRSSGCEGYSCSCSIAGLPAGNYIGYAIAQNGTASKKFKI